MTFEEAYAATKALMPPNHYFSLQYTRSEFTEGKPRQSCYIIFGKTGTGAAKSTQTRDCWSDALAELKRLIEKPPAVIEQGPDELPRAEKLEDPAQL